MSLREELNKKLGDTKPIEGFRVMEWLRGVRDANYELSIKDPEAYRKEEEEACARIDDMIRRQKQREQKLQSL